MPKFIILDRDGVINKDSYDYIKNPEEFIFLPGSIEAISLLTKAGYTIGLATNQSGITRGYYNLETLAQIHEKMRKGIEKEGGQIHFIEYCPHLPHEGCECRKPKPGMLIKLGQHFGCEMKDIIFVGDRISDIEAAYAVGAKPVLIQSMMTNVSLLVHYPEVPIYPSLYAFALDILKNET